MVFPRFKLERLCRVTGIFLTTLMLIAGCGDESRNTTQNEGREQTSPSLAAAYQNDFLIGVALNRKQTEDDNPKATQLISRHFNTITPENLLKWENVHPDPGQYNFGPADTFVKFSEQYDMFMVGHTLVWHNQTPDWVFENDAGEALGREALLKRMKRHIDSVMGRYKGHINAWDVVNEAVLDEGGVRKSKWHEIVGEDYVEKAFQYAHETDPGAELYYNDYNLWKPAKRQAAADLIKRLQSNDIPVHGIGMQAHLDIDYPPIEQIEASIEAFSELGIKVMITELDIDVLPDEDDVDEKYDPEEDKEMPAELNPYTEGLPDSVQQKLTERYVALFKLFKKHRGKIDRVTFWGLHDHQSWLNYYPLPDRTNYPLLFDRNLEAKPALSGILEVAEEE